MIILIIVIIVVIIICKANKKNREFTDDEIAAKFERAIKKIEKK